MYNLTLVLQRICFKTAEEGARGTIYASVLPPNSIPSGSYIADVMLAPVWQLSQYATNDAMAQELWAQCEKAVKGR